jgi:Tol biopolymer transport system component
MKPATLFLLTGLLCIGPSTVYPVSQAKDDRAEVALQAAIKKEMVDGDLKGAIEQYMKIAQSGNRAAAARALVRMGQCQERLGEAEARKAYEKVVREYADQTEAAAEARARLVALGSPGGDPRLAREAGESATLIFRKIEFAGQGRTHLARLSPDGSKVLYVDMKDKETRDSLWLEELPAGPEKRLVEGVTAGNILFFVWSPDGRKIAYKQGRGEIRVIDADGGELRTLWATADQRNSVYPMDWSRDGQNILVATENEADRTMQLALLPSSGGEPRTVLTQPLNEWAPYPRFSPDGRFIVGSKTTKGNSDVYIWSVDGGQAIRLVEHPARDESPLWSPDGRWIVFVSDRDKTKDLWAVPMQGSNAAGAPVPIKRNLGKGAWVTDFTQNGTLTMLMVGEGATNDLFVLPVDPLTGEARGQFVPFAKYPTDHFMPRWSPDGKCVAYTSRKGEISLPRIYVSSGSEKEDEEMPAPNYFVGNVEWSRGGQSLIFPGLDPEGRSGLYRISMNGFGIELLQPGGKRGVGYAGAFVNLRWLPRANRFSVDRLGDKNKIGEIYTMDADGKNVQLATDKISADVWTWPSPNGKYVAYVEGRRLKLWSMEEDKPLSTLVQFPEGKAYEGPAWSPDGYQVAFKDQQQLKVVTLPEGTSRVLLQAGTNTEIGEVPWAGGLAWSPDGRTIAYSLQDISKSSKPRSELWAVPAAGGAPRKVADAPVSHPRLSEIIWHPSGARILAGGGPEKTQPRTYEHWAMENFLPKR